MTHYLAVEPEDLLVARYAALAIGVHILEAGFPSPLPGVKPGLANMVSLLVLYVYGWKIAMWVTGLRVLVGSLLMGSFLSPAFFLSLGGAVASMLVLRLTYRIPVIRLGPVGVSTLASLGHMGTQFLVAYTLFIPHAALFKLLPPLMSAALVFGLVNGIVVQKLLRKMQQ